VVEGEKNEEIESRNYAASLITSSYYLNGCSQSPQPIKYGAEECANCKMTIMNPRFAGEIITVKGKIYKFDDVHALYHSYNRTKIKMKRLPAHT
jgi:copper chaperone NosL